MLHSFSNLPNNLADLGPFALRHLGPRIGEVGSMLECLEHKDIPALLEATIPPGIRTGKKLELPAALSETGTLAELRSIMSQNRVAKNFIGMGYNPSITPPVIQRAVFENPGWYTQYTPYQAEISQGRLEVLFYFQTMICDLTGMDVANASLLDEGTAAAEAVTLAYGIKGGNKRNRVIIGNACHPQTEAVLRTRTAALGIQVENKPLDGSEEGVIAVLLQSPDTFGGLPNLKKEIEKIHEIGALAIVSADLFPLTLMEPPGSQGADIVVGTSQAFGIPLGYGGPHAAFLATRDKYKRKIPGRIVGLSKDAQGKPAYRLALQTREQHIRREKATSNICTAQALLANMAALYAIYHGPEGLKEIAINIHKATVAVATALERDGYELKHKTFFDTLVLNVADKQKAEILARASAAGINFRFRDIDGIALTLNETVTQTDLEALLQVIDPNLRLPEQECEEERWPKSLSRSTPFLTDKVFTNFRSETEMLRFIKRQEAKDLSLTTSMIPLGSCTMKLNAAVEMQALSWAEVSSIHPFCPTDQARGYATLFTQLEAWLAAVTGFDAVSLQPNAGSQGEYAGLLAIKGYQDANDGANRDICLIPTSAHGTNPASAVMAGFKVVPVKCDAEGNIDIEHLRALAEKHSTNLGALMITYPSTHGVFEEGIIEINQIIHDHGGQVYLDGANLNAQVGLCTPGELGADVCHLNLHKTFCIPHGGGGPGVGPIAVKAHLSPYLPSTVKPGDSDESVIGPVSAAPYGSASILTISWAYIAAMGSAGLTAATGIAILNANYIARRLQGCFPILYRGNAGMVAHECIVDLRQFKIVTVEDVAKRLMDYGFHAPTISWPVAGTMMIEPTESESLQELDRFCEAMIAIHGEIQEIESGKVDAIDNLLKNAPHTSEMIAADSWEHPYPRSRAAFPLPYLRDFKFWPAVARIDNVYGDRHPVCSCQGMEQYEVGDH